MLIFSFSVDIELANEPPLNLVKVVTSFLPSSLSGVYLLGKVSSLLSSFWRISTTDIPRRRTVFSPWMPSFGNSQRATFTPLRLSKARVLFQVYERQIPCDRRLRDELSCPLLWCTSWVLYGRTEPVTAKPIWLTRPGDTACMSRNQLNPKLTLRLLIPDVFRWFKLVNQNSPIVCRLVKTNHNLLHIRQSYFDHRTQGMYELRPHELAVLLSFAIGPPSTRD